MAVDYHALSTATDTHQPLYTTDIVADTDKRDVSDMLDLLALDDTPFINAVGWGPESGGEYIEWIKEDLGYGYLKAVSVVGSAGVSIKIASVENLTSTEALKQVQEGTILYYYSSTDGTHAITAVLSVTTATGTITFEVLSTVVTFSANTSIAVADKIWILGAVANEGSLPRTNANVRARAVEKNDFNILRQDVNTSGSMLATDMYAIGREDLHQIRMRLIEMQREREKMALYAVRITQAAASRSTTEASLMHGALGFLVGTAGDSIDTTTTTLTESALNTVVGGAWENGGKNFTFFGDRTQCAKFTQWDKNRIRMAPRDGRGGGYINMYMTEVGLEIKVQPMRRVPKNIALVVDTSLCRLRAKKGRKAILEKLGKKGDFEAHQIISEFSFEMKGYSLGKHGLFTRLS
jgi:hypothetical protein